MFARNHFLSGFLRGLNSTAEAFAPYSWPDERSDLERMRPILLLSSAELRKIEEIIPGGADRIRRMAEMEQAHRFEDVDRGHQNATRGQYLGWASAAGAIIAAALVGLRHGPWQVSVALVGIPVLGGVIEAVTRRCCLGE